MIFTYHWYGGFGYVYWSKKGFSGLLPGSCIYMWMYMYGPYFTLPDRTYVYIRYVYIYPMGWRDQYHHIHCPLSSTHTAIRADPVFRGVLFHEPSFFNYAMAPCRSWRSLWRQGCVHTYTCSYMYSLRKCTVVSCNAACLSWFRRMGWDVERRRWDDLCCYPWSEGLRKMTYLCSLFDAATS